MSKKHEKHKKTFCKVVEKKGQSNLGKKTESQNRYICLSCGRADKNEDYLCDPAKA